MINDLECKTGSEFGEIKLLIQRGSPNIRFVVFKCFDKSLEDLRKSADELVCEMGGRKCYHEHDCCGCWALSDMEVLGFPTSQHSFILVEHWEQNV